MAGWLALSCLSYNKGPCWLKPVKIPRRSTDGMISCLILSRPVGVAFRCFIVPIERARKLGITCRGYRTTIEWKCPFKLYKKTWSHFYFYLYQTPAGAHIVAVHDNICQLLWMWTLCTVSAAFSHEACTGNDENNPKICWARWRKLKEVARQRGTKCYMHGYQEGEEKAWCFSPSRRAERR